MGHWRFRGVKQPGYVQTQNANMRYLWREVSSSADYTVPRRVLSSRGSGTALQLGGAMPEHGRLRLGLELTPVFGITPLDRYVAVCQQVCGLNRAAPYTPA